MANTAAMEAITKLKSTDPPQFLKQNSDLSLSSRIASQHLFALLKPHTPKSPFDQLLTDGFDAEQIWQQIDIQSQPLISSLSREIKRFEKNPDKISSLFGEKEENGLLGSEFDDVEEMGLDGDSEDFEDEDEDEADIGESEDEDEDEDEEEEDEDEEMEDDGDGTPEVEDEFFKIKELEKFLANAEKSEYGEDETVTKKKKKKKGDDKKVSKKGADDEDEDDDEESASDEDTKTADTNELLMYGGGDDSEDEAAYNIRFDDFYLPTKITPKQREKRVEKSYDVEMEDGDEMNIVPKRRRKQDDESDESEEPEMDDGEETQNNENLSTHERERQKLQAKIKQMEEANLAAKDWTMQGEVTASKRPRDSALEVDLDFEHNVRPPPVITEEVTTSLEDIIKKRISEGNFDDVQRAPKLPSAAPKERKELDENKSKKGLAEIYEEEYAQQTGLAAAPLSHNDELRNEASGLFKRLCLKLDALSHFHFAPKPVVEDMTIQTNVAALAMEEVAPLAVSDASMLAPQEVFAGKGDIKEDTELTKEDRKRLRAKKKRTFKAVSAARTASRPVDKTLQNQSEGKEQ